jgi:hypothetical protein
MLYQLVWSGDMWDVEIAKQLKKRDVKIPLGPLLGNVISIDPINIAILGDKVILTEKQCYLCSNLIKDYIRKADVNTEGYSVGASATDTRGDSISSITIDSKEDYNVEITFKEILKKGDKVLCLPTSDGQTFFIIDKVVI